MKTILDHYEFCTAEAAIFVEVYLPKRAIFQGELYDALSEGFDPDVVRQYLQDHRQEIRDKYLRGSYSGYLSDDYDKDPVESMGRIMGGYSLYEVDGVFFNTEKRRIDEERTQVIRIFFRPDPIPDVLQAQPKLKNKIVRDYLRTTDDRSTFAEAFKKQTPLAPDLVPDVDTLVAFLERWEAQVALFVFGFIVFKLGEKIKKLREQKGIEEEDEIWVTSFWNLVVNRVVAVRSSGEDRSNENAA